MIIYLHEHYDHDGKRINWRNINKHGNRAFIRLETRWDDVEAPK